MRVYYLQYLLFNVERYIQLCTVRAKMVNVLAWLWTIFLFPRDYSKKQKRLKSSKLFFKNYDRIQTNVIVFVIGQSVRTCHIGSAIVIITPEKSTTATKNVLISVRKRFSSPVRARVMRHVFRLKPYRFAAV